MDMAAFLTLSIICVSIVVSLTSYWNYKIRKDIQREVTYSRIMLSATQIENQFYAYEKEQQFSKYPAIRKYIFQCSYMLDNGIPLYKEAKISRFTAKDKGFEKLINELVKAPAELRNLTCEQASILSKIIEIRNPFFGCLNRVKKMYLCEY